MKLRAIIKRPDEKYGHVTNISDTLQNLRRTVGGRIETVTYPGKDPKDTFVIICREDGLIDGMPFNCIVDAEDPRWTLRGPIRYFGDIIVLGVSGDEFKDCPLQLAEWKKMIKEVIR